MKNLELQQQEWKKLEPCLANINENDFKAILAIQYLMVGLRSQNFPDSQEEAFLSNFIRKNYGSYHPNNFSEAFEMAICGKLDLKDTSCYENFSCEYVARIMNSYKQYLILSGRLKSNLDLERQFKPMDKNLLDAPKMTDDEIVEVSFELWKPKKNWRFISVNAYKILRNQGKIILTEQQKEHFRSLARAEIINEEGKDSFAFKGLDKDYYTQMYAAKLATQSYFKTLL